MVIVKINKRKAYLKKTNLNWFCKNHCNWISALFTDKFSESNSISNGVLNETNSLNYDHDFNGTYKSMLNIFSIWSIASFNQSSHNQSSLIKQN
ncbi:hypothetical protein BpHYR1_029869 [Brachionus plicatilis]|uniref:Uncharacterized protein n=1 Tax=Brachionus plicatilis TaxID=10195 RepID=A0A3M7P4A7_BRAPC|nr:hypothetical protein BpHYR1_029869 [Brachionus plicatilis]